MSESTDATQSHLVTRDSLPTPRTDAVEKRYIQGYRGFFEDMKQLERQLHVAVEALTCLVQKEKWPSLAGYKTDEHEGDWQERASACINEINEALRRIEEMKCT